MRERKRRREGGKVVEKERNRDKDRKGGRKREK